MITGIAAFFRPLWIVIVVCIPLYLLSVFAIPIYDFIFPWKRAVDELAVRYPGQNRFCLGIGFSAQSNSESSKNEYQRSFLLFPSFLNSRQSVTVIETTTDGTSQLKVISSSISILLEILIYMGCAIFTWKVSIPWFKRCFRKH
mgnify:CR=1 FL=1|jgi:hypothetical protein